jgi:hypothetical protein
MLLSKVFYTFSICIAKTVANVDRKYWTCIGWVLYSVSYIWRNIFSLYSFYIFDFFLTRERIPSCLVFEFWPWAIGPRLKIEIPRLFSSSPWNFWSIEYNHALYWKFGTMAWLGSRPRHRSRWPWVQQKNIPGAETFRRSPHMFNSDGRNSSYAQKSVFS